MLAWPVHSTTSEFASSCGSASRSMPLPSGRRRSSSRMSGCCNAIWRRASRRLCATATVNCSPAIKARSEAAESMSSSTTRAWGMAKLLPAWPTNGCPPRVAAAPAGSLFSEWVPQTASRHRRVVVSLSTVGLAMTGFKLRPARVCGRRGSTRSMRADWSRHVQRCGQRLRDACPLRVAAAVRAVGSVSAVGSAAGRAAGRAAGSAAGDAAGWAAQHPASRDRSPAAGRAAAGR